MVDGRKGHGGWEIRSCWMGDKVMVDEKRQFPYVIFFYSNIIQQTMHFALLFIGASCFYIVKK